MKQKAKWGLLERLLAAALVLSLAAAGVFLWLFSREAREYTNASDDYDKVREQYLGTVVPDTLPPELMDTPAPEGGEALPVGATAGAPEAAQSGPEAATPIPSPTVELEQEADEEALELTVILHNEAVAVSRNGATTTPMPTPAPTGMREGDGVGGKDAVGADSGVTGTDGSTGRADSGVMGADGSTGRADSGAMGADGSTGRADSGVMSADGSTGGVDSSTMGSDGSTGGADSGVTGADGSTGGADSGVTGADGSTGGVDSGAMGADGSTGGVDSSPINTDSGATGATTDKDADGADGADNADDAHGADASSISAAVVTPEPPRVGRSVTEKVRYSVDFPSLQEVNEDVCAWLLQENTAISYPVVQGYNNTFYLEHLYTGLKSQAGSIFADCGNSRYFTDMVTYLYGHNRKDGAMFASIPEYMNQAYANQYPSFYLLTPYMDYRLDVFACIRVSVDDKDDWHTKSFAGKREFDDFLARVQKQSAIRTSVAPEWGDRLLALCTCTNEVHEERYVVYTRMSPIQYETDESVSLIRRELDTADTLTHIIDVPVVGEMLYYANNDPLWASMRYEGLGGTGRRMGSGGSGPCAMAMVTAKMMDPQYLWWLNYYSGREQGHTFCTCSVNQYFCNRRHAQYRLQTPEEFLRYLPVAMASFATGNNQWGENSRKISSGTSATFMKRVCDIFGLYFESTRESDAVFEMLGRGGMVVTVCGSDFDGGRHYVVIASMDDTYLYILDPYYMDEYSQKTGLEMMEPGLLRAKIEDWETLHFGTCYLMKQWPY